MPIRLRAKRDNSSRTGEQVDPVTHETTVDGMTFAWGPGNQRVIGDDGVANAHRLFDAGRGANVFEDNSLVTVPSVQTVGSRS